MLQGERQRGQRPRPVCDMQELADLGVGERTGLGTYSMYLLVHLPIEAFLAAKIIGWLAHCMYVWVLFLCLFVLE